MDHYGTMENLLAAFVEFVNRLPKDGIAVVCGDNDNIRYVMSQVDHTFYTYGFDESNDYMARNVHYVDGHLVYDVYYKGQSIARLTLRVPGRHNVLNSMAAFITCHAVYGLSVEVCQKA